MLHFLDYLLRIGKNPLHRLYRSATYTAMDQKKPVQGVCLAARPGAGAMYMRFFDALPAEVREKVRNSPFNLCSSCLFGMYGGDVERMEERIRFLERSKSQ